ncbi:MAG TPA: PepSY domain-containing protein [Ignavibacteriaceae bacterium]|nr:PepSY domain-containing protein [Ignavibacteriaceae bacterium]
MESQSVVPGDVLKKSNQFIISKVGQEYFDKYIKPDFQETKKLRSQYQMVYNFRIPDKPYVDSKIKFTVDSTGRITDEKNTTGLPDCLSNPEKCEFNIDKEQAVSIAEENNLPKGIKDWKIEFKWEPEKNQYVWSILTTQSESQGSFGFRGSGEIMLIDPNTGEVISQKPWHVM